MPPVSLGTEVLRIEDVLEVLVRIEMTICQKTLGAGVWLAFNAVLPAVVLCDWRHLLLGRRVLFFGKRYIRWATSLRLIARV